MVNLHILVKFGRVQRKITSKNIISVSKNRALLRIRAISVVMDVDQSEFEYTLIRPDDFQELKTLHEQLLPVCVVLSYAASATPLRYMVSNLTFCSM